jgi:cardiolipin synthase
LFELDRDTTAGFDRAAGRLSAQFPAMADTMVALLQISRRVTGRPLLAGNRVTPLYDGEQAYPVMLDAIARAEKYVYLCTYLFDTDQAGRRFIDALGDAAARGVDVRVLVDAVGERYARPRASRLLRKKPRVKVARFLPLMPSLRGLRVNLRNHRKLLVCDGRIGFTGGMNLGQRHMVSDSENPKPTADIHFSVEGPAVFALEEVFFEDWHFTTEDEDWEGYRPTDAAGQALCRGIKDGPNEDFEKLQWILVGAISSARDSVKIMTPYFVPGRELLAALNAAALRGTAVEVILPEQNNLPYVKWASQAMLWELLQYGVQFFYQPPPFNHSKYLLVDDFYVNIGSANLDPRSLRLNFEFNLEVYDPELGKELAAHFDRARKSSRQITQDFLENRPLAIKLRDAAAKLFAPYL